MCSFHIWCVKADGNEMKGKRITVKQTEKIKELRHNLQRKLTQKEMKYKTIYFIFFIYISLFYYFKKHFFKDWSVEDITTIKITIIFNS